MLPESNTTWLFDLDNTLYDAGEGILEQVHQQINRYLSELYQIDETKAAAIRHDLFLKHGTTLGGLLQERGEKIDVPAYCRHIYDIDLDGITPATELDTLLQQLPGRKLVFTNSEKTYAKRVLARLGIAEHFDDIFDIVAADCISKPQQHPYDKICETFTLDPKNTVFVDDMAHNLLPAKQMGMTTVWLRTPHSKALLRGNTDHVDYVIDDLNLFLHQFQV